MRPVFSYLINTDRRYNNSIDIEGVDFVVNTEISERDASFVNRIGKVLHTPINSRTDIQAGDEVILHHNVFRTWYDIRGKLRNSGNYVDENLYAVQDDQIFAYRTPGGSWKSLPRYCFVSPVKQEISISNIYGETLVGEICMEGEYLDKLGLSLGDVVGFTPDSEYEFDIEGKKMYRILLNQLSLKYEPQERETENNRVSEEVLS